MMHVQKLRNLLQDAPVGVVTNSERVNRWIEQRDALLEALSSANPGDRIVALPLVKDRQYSLSEIIDAARFAANVIQAQGMYDLSERMAYEKLLAALEAYAVSTQEKVISQIRAERARQDKKWGEQNHDPADWLAILAEEVGEANEAFLRWRFEQKSIADMEDELIQVAAVAVSIIESMKRTGYFSNQ